MNQLTPLALLPGVRLYALSRPDFKTNLLTFSFQRRLARGTAGLGAMLPHVLRRGTRLHPETRDLTMALSRQYGARLEPFCRKKGETQCVGLTAVFPGDRFLPGDTEVFREVVRLTRETLLNPAGNGEGFVPDTVAQEKTLWLDRIRAAKNEKSSYAAKRLLKCMCEDEAYGADALGEETDDVSGNLLFSEYRRLLLRAPIDIIYVGGMATEELAGPLTEVFQVPMRHDIAALEPTQVIRQAGALRTFEETMDVAQGKLVLGMRLGCSSRDPSYPAALLASALFGGGTTSKLFLNVRERLSLAYTAASWTEGAKGLLLVSCGIDPGKKDEVEAEIFVQWASIVSGHFSESELDATRRGVMNALRTTGDTPFRLEDFALGQATSGLRETPDGLAERIARVSRDDIVRAASAGVWDSVYFLRGERDTK